MVHPRIRGLIRWAEEKCVTVRFGTHLSEETPWKLDFLDFFFFEWLLLLSFFAGVRSFRFAALTCSRLFCFVCCYGFGRVSCFYLQTGALTTTDKNNKHTHAHTDDFRERRTQAHAHVQTNTPTHTRAQRDFGFELLLSSSFSFLLLCPFCFCAFYLISVSACR